ncbi:MAG: AAA family ATPase [Syntrophobacteraceae bacterium]
MAIITISRGSYSKGKDVAKLVADRLGYRCIAREVLLDASREFNMPEIRLVRAIHDAPSILDRFTHGKEKYITSFRAAMLKQFAQDNVVYHGLAGHFFVKGISHALKVRIIADMEDRVRTEMERMKLPREEALRILKSDDEERRKWSLNLYGIDTTDPSLYDLVIHIRKIKVEDAVDMICQVVGMDRFRTTGESQRAVENMALAAEVKAALIEIDSDVEVSANNGFVKVEIRVPIEEQEERVSEVGKILKSLAGVSDFDIKVLQKVKLTDGRLFP